MTETTQTRYSKLTPEQKERYFGESRNARRRSMYTSDAEYRNDVLSSNRESYRRVRGEYGAREQPDIKMMEDKFHMKRVKRKIKGSELGEMSVIKRQDLLRSMRVSNTTLNRWLRQGLFPAPELYEFRENDEGTYVEKKTTYYSEEEARILFSIYDEHLKETLQYSTYHQATKDAFYEGVKQVRQHWRK